MSKILWQTPTWIEGGCFMTGNDGREEKEKRRRWRSAPLLIFLDPSLATQRVVKVQTTTTWHICFL